MRSRPDRFSLPAALAALLLLALSGEVPAFELRLWPLIDVEPLPNGHRVRIAGPIVEWRRDADGRAFSLRPLFHARKSTGGASRGALLYPLATWRRSEEGVDVRVLGLASYRRSARPTPISPWTRDLTVFPFLFVRSGPERPTSFSLLPLYGNVHGLLGYERVQMILFPLYLRLVEPLHDRQWLPFPFFSRAGGRLGRGVRVWPIYGRTEVGNESSTVYVGWPFYLRRVDHPGRDGQVSTRISWPLFSVLEGPALESRSYGFLLVLPLYTRTLDRRQQTETIGFPWPFWVVQRSTATGERTTLRLAPFYQDRRTPSLRSVFVFWPFYRRREGVGEDAGYARTDVLFVLYRDQRDGHRSVRAMIPLGIVRKDSGHERSQMLTLLDGIFPANEMLAELWAPLWRIYGREGRDGETADDLLWGMWRWRGGHIRPPLYVSTD